MPSLLRGLRLSKLFGRDGVITLRVERARSSLVRGSGLPRLVFPGFRDIRGYRAMYRDFVARDSRRRRAPEMSLERAIEDQRLMDQVYADRRPHGTDTLDAHEHYDIVIIGSGAGGGTIAHALADARRAHARRRARRLRAAGRRRTGIRRRSGSSCATGPRAVARRATAASSGPYTHYSVGGNTKFWGSVLYRLRREDFQAIEHVDGVSPAWPIDYDTLAPYYERAERLYHVHGAAPASIRRKPPRGPIRIRRFRTRPGMAAIVERLRAQGLHPSPLPLGLIRPGEPDGCVLCNTCNSFPCKIHAKSDADVCCVRPALRQAERHAVDQRARASGCMTDAVRRRVEAVEVERHGETMRVEAPLFVVSCGAVNSAALLLRSASAAHPHGLANSSGLVGRRYMAHLATMMQGVPSVPARTRPFSEDGGDQRLLPARARHAPYPLGQIQSQGRTHGVMAQVRRRHDRPVDPAVGLRPWVGARRGLAGDVRGSAARGQPRDGRAPTAGSGCTTAPNNLGAHERLVKETEADPAAPRLLDRDDALARGAATRRTSAARCASAPIRARRCSIRTAARTTSRICSSSTPRSSPRLRPSIRG